MFIRSTLGRCLRFNIGSISNTVNPVHQQHLISNLRWASALNRRFSTTPTSTIKDSTKAVETPKLLTQLFPQTSGALDEQAKIDEQRKEEEEKKEQQRSWKWQKIGYQVFGVALVGNIVYGIHGFGSPNRDDNGNIIHDEFSDWPIIQQYLGRSWKSIKYFVKWVEEPSCEKLLPDPLKPPYIQPEYTLVLEMKDVLVHPDWTYQTGWRFKKRPGIDNFLEQLAGQFEIVIFTADQGTIVFPILDALDPHGFIMYRLVRDATHFVDGHHVKNLDNLNRDLNKVIVIDWDPNSTKLHPQNTFNIERWLGNDDDTALFDLVAFLKTVANAKVEDVREVLVYYKQFDNPLAQFRENQRKLLQQMHDKQLEEQSAPKAPVKKWTPSFLAHK